jgi:molecular chaperone DnaJ
MTALDHYQTLEVSPTATLTEVKQAYRRLAKQFHPDRQPQGSAEDKACHDQISRINAAYEVLSDSQARLDYDRQRLGGFANPESMERAAAAQSEHQQRPTAQATDAHLHAWLQHIYQPINDRLHQILDPLEDQIADLAADPFDDELAGAFQDYLNDCRQSLGWARKQFQSMPNPANFAGVAAYLYYCINHIGDGLDDLDFFLLNYDEHYLHVGQELFRIARGLQRDAAMGVGVGSVR